jgi:hypothetical protein
MYHRCNTVADGGSTSHRANPDSRARSPRALVAVSILLAIFIGGDWAHLCYYNALLRTQCFSPHWSYSIASCTVFEVCSMQ